VTKRVAQDIAKGTLGRSDIPVIPQSVELVNQTVSVPKEPLKDSFVWKQILEYRNLAANQQLKSDFENAIRRYTAMRQKQQEDKARL